MDRASTPTNEDTSNRVVRARQNEEILLFVVWAPRRQEDRRGDLTNLCLCVVISSNSGRQFSALWAYSDKSPGSRRRNTTRNCHPLLSRLSRERSGRHIFSHNSFPVGVQLRLRLQVTTRHHQVVVLQPELRRRFLMKKRRTRKINGT